MEPSRTANSGRSDLDGYLQRLSVVVGSEFSCACCRANFVWTREIKDPKRYPGILQKK